MGDWRVCLGRGSDMAFDDIPEDDEQTFKCTNHGGLCGGNIAFDYVTGLFECDSCEWNSASSAEQLDTPTKQE